MKKVPEVGDLISLKAFAFSNKGGGTGMSNWNWDEKYAKPVTVKVTKEWEDDECGQRGWAVPLPDDKDLLAYLERNAGKPIIYWGEFDILDVFSPLGDMPIRYFFLKFNNPDVTAPVCKTDLLYQLS